MGAEKAAVLLLKKLQAEGGSTLNIAGNGIYTCAKYGASQEQLNKLVYDIVSSVHSVHPITKVFTGGQTGVDIAGAAAAYKLGIPCEITLPKGYLQRNVSGQDESHTREDIETQIITFAANIP